MAFSLFQFLIGSLKTGDYEGLYYVDWEFQFLIGSLKTKAAGAELDAHKSEFQFLIGSLKTLILDLLI